MKIKISFTGYKASGDEESGKIIADLPDNGFIEQFRVFGEVMHRLAKENEYVDLYDTEVEEV